MKKILVSLLIITFGICGVCFAATAKRAIATPKPPVAKTAATLKVNKNAKPVVSRGNVKSDVKSDVKPVIKKANKKTVKNQINKKDRVPKSK